MCFEVEKEILLHTAKAELFCLHIITTRTKLQIRYSSLSKRSFKVVYLPVPETPPVPNLAFNTICLLYTAFPLLSLFFFALFELEWSICIEFDMQNRVCKHHRQLILNNNLCSTSLKVHFFPRPALPFTYFPFTFKFHAKITVSLFKKA